MQITQNTAPIKGNSPFFQNNSKRENAYYKLADLHSVRAFSDDQMIYKGQKIYSEIAPFFVPQMTANQLFNYLDFHLNHNEQSSLSFF